MSKTEFASAIIGQLQQAIGTDGSRYGSSVTASSMNAVGNAITSYLIAHTTVTVSYSGIIPGAPPQPDPLITDTFRIVGSCVLPSTNDSFDSWLLKIGSAISAGFSLAPQGNAGLVFVQKPFLNLSIPLTQSRLKSEHNPQDKSPQQKIWEIVCDSVMNWCSAVAPNKVAGAATHPSVASTGTASITQIVIT